jgi:hypothetical protein
MTSPDFVQPDPRHPERQRSYKAIVDMAAACCALCAQLESDDNVI